MIYSVTGAGPRTGTSWTMGKLIEAGLPVYWTESLNIAGSKYDTWHDEFSELDNVIAKVWPNHLQRANVAKMVVLHRNESTQLKSIKQQMKRERNQGLVIEQTPKQLIDQAKWILDQIKIPRLVVRTEELDDRIDEIIEWMSVPFEQVEIM